MHIAYFRNMQALVAESTPSECVVLFNTELFALDAHAHTSNPRPYGPTAGDGVKSGI
jgi:hypothetical protein